MTAILEKAGGKTLDVDGKKVAGKRLVARLLWEVAASGKTKFPDGSEIIAGTSDWLDVVKFIYAQIDGAPKQTHELTGDGGGPLTVVEEIIRVRSSDSDIPTAGELP